MQRPAAGSHERTEQDWWWIFDPRLSLRARSALIFGGSAVAFTLLLSSVSGAFVQRAVEAQVGASFETLAFQMSDKLDRVIYQRFHELQLAAGLGPFRSGDAAPADRRFLLEALQDASRDFAWIGFADAQGRIQVSTRKLLEDSSVENRPWFRLGRERPYTGNLGEIPALVRALGQTDEAHAQRFLDLAVPVNEVSGQFLGVLGAHLHWDWAREVQTSVIAETARKDRIGVTVYSASGEVLLDSGGSGWSLPPEAPVIAEARRFRGFMTETASTGTRYLTGFARSRGYHEFRGFGWMVAVRQPLDRALTPAYELSHRITGWGLGFAAIIIVVSWFTAEALIRRLRGIGTAARRIEEGDVLTVLPGPRGGAEVDRMCVSLGRMVEDFRQKQDELARENARLEERLRAAGEPPRPPQ